MPRNFKLTWQAGADGRSGRWRKKYKGRKYYFPGGRGKSDSEAYDKALNAWEAMKVRLDQEAPKPHQSEYELAIDEWEQVLAWCNKHAEREMAQVAGQKLDTLRKCLAVPGLKPLDTSDTFAGQFEVPSIPALDQLFEHGMTVDMSQLRLAAPRTLNDAEIRRYSEELDGSPLRIAREIWQDRLEVQGRNAASQDESLEAHIKSYLEERERQASAGEVSIGRVYALRLHLAHFQDWLGKTTAVAEINGRTLMAYRGELLSEVTSEAWSRTTAKHYLTTVKSFVRWLWQIEAIPSLPRVMDGRSKALNIGRSLSGIVVFTKEEVKSLLAGASDRTKLYILLMLNCGMTQKDISDLLVSQVDWENGRIIRRRSKTQDCENVPVVNYLLWPETFQLLKQERSVESSDQVLLNSNGSPLWCEEIKAEGKYRKMDNIKNAFDRLQKKTKIEKPLKSLKKTSATLLRGEGRFSSLESLFLGHAPQSMSDRHYAQVPQGLLDEAIGWLGREYGVM